MAWPETWEDVRNLPKPRRTQRMVQIARGVASRAHRILRSSLIFAQRQKSTQVDGVPGGALALHEFATDHPLLYLPIEETDGPLRLLREHDRATAPDGYLTEYHDADPAYHDRVHLWTRRQKRALTKAWTERWSLMHGRMMEELWRIRLLAAQVAGDQPVHGDDGQELTGDAALAERRRLYAGPLCEAWRVIGSLNDGINLLHGATQYDVPADALSPDLSVAKAQLFERIDDAARDHLAYLLDCEDPAYARPVGTEQSTAVALLERRRQDGRQSVRAAATAAAALTASTNAIGLIEGVVVEHAPVWRSSQGGALSLSRKMFLPTWISPGAGRYTFSLRVARTGERAAATDAIGLEAQDLPIGWSVSLGAKLSNAAAWPVAVTAPAALSPGDYDFTLVARDAIGPARLRVRVRVPAASQ